MNHAHASHAFDGFAAGNQDAFTGLRPDTDETFWRWMARACDLVGATLTGLERLPTGPSLIVSNHAFGWDIALALALVRRANGMRIWVLGEHLWWKVPFLRVLASAVGVVDGTPTNIDQLLELGQPVLVLPGGLREALKPRDLRYRLLWGKRYGFVRAALRHGVPIVPLASLGPDEWFDWVGNPFVRGQRFLRPLGIPLPLPRPWAGLPWLHLVRPRYVIGEPITVPRAPERQTDEALLRSLRRQVSGALHEIIDEDLSRRVGMDDPPRTHNE